MKPAMTHQEIALLSAFLRSARGYLEFGCGGSTWLATGLVRDRVTSVDSSADWLAQVRDACAEDPARLVPDLRHVDIGPLGKWGKPADPATATRWPEYHGAIWADPQAATADFLLIDGRFRVACAMQALLHTRPGALIAVHDYAKRPHYAPIARVAREVARAQTLVIFTRPEAFDRATTEAILAEHRLQPA